MHAATPSDSASPPADLVLVHSKIWTGDPGKPEAEALAARGGRIVAVGSDGEIAMWKGNRTAVVDAAGRRVVPGFIDAYMHMSMGGFNLLALDLRRTRDPGEFSRSIAAFAKTRPAGAWLTDGAWDREQRSPQRL